MEFQNRIDIAGAKERFMGNEGLYKRFLFRFPEENRFAQIVSYVEDGNINEAFETAHAMKGVVANLALEELYESVSKVTELLREDQTPEKAQIEELREVYDHTVKMIKKMRDENTTLF